MVCDLIRLLVVWSTAYACPACQHMLVPHFITDALVLEIKNKNTNLKLHCKMLYVKAIQYLILNMDREIVEYARYWLHCIVYPSYELSCWLFILSVAFFQLFLTNFCFQNKAKSCSRIHVLIVSCYILPHRTIYIFNKFVVLPLC